MRFSRNTGSRPVPVAKIGKGRPDLTDAMANGEVQLLVNTPSGQRSADDGSSIRKAAIKHKIPYITTTAAAIASARGIAARQESASKVRSLQSYHEAIR